MSTAIGLKRLAHNESYLLRRDVMRSQNALAHQAEAEHAGRTISYMPFNSRKPT